MKILRNLNYRLRSKKDKINKTGVYCLLNLINGNIYIRNSINIALRGKII